MSYLFSSSHYTELNHAHGDKVRALLAETTDESEQFTILRCAGIGGSDMAKLMNESPWGTPFTLWQDKTLRSERFGAADNVFTHWGTILEQPIKREYWDLVGHIYGDHIDANISLVYPQLPIIQANIDGLILEKNKPVRIVEIKTAMLNSSTGQFNEYGQAKLNWGDGNIYQTENDEVVGIAQEDSQVPRPYYLQVQLYMLVARVEVADIAVLIGHHDFRVFTIHADHVLHQEMLEKIDEFWCRNVLDDNPPELTAADLDTERSVSSKVKANEFDMKVYSQLISTRNQIKQLTADKEQLENQLKERIGLSDMLTDPNGKPLCTYKTTAARKTFDSAAFKKENPKIYAKYLRDNTPSRRFLIKEVSDD